MALAQERLLRRSMRARTRRTWFVVAGLALIAAGAWWFDTWSRSTRPGDAQTAAHSSHATAAQATGSGAASASQALALPDSLQGSSPPPLPLEAGGRLARTHAVREFFDYFLSASGERSAVAIDALVHRAIATQLDGTAAAAEALDAWRRYTAYRSALDQLPRAATTPGPSLDLDALQRTLDQRATLAAQTMGEWNEPFFGAELRRARNDLARMRIASDPSLTEADKAARLAALDSALPASERDARERVKKQQAAIDAIAQMQKQGASTDAIRAQVTQTLGPEAAQRVVQMEQTEAAWQSRYADYSAQRAQIDRMGLAPQDRDAQVAQLRQRLFSNPSDALRAQSLDRGASPN